MLRKRWQDYASKARNIAKHIINSDEINQENDTKWSKIINILDVYATAVLNDKYVKDGSISSIHTYWGGNQEIATVHKDGSHGLFQIHGIRQSSNNAMDIEVEEYMNNINENKKYKTNKKMKKQVIRLTESELNQIIEESVRTIISENMDEGMWDTMKSFASQYGKRGANKAQQMGASVGSKMKDMYNKGTEKVQQGINKAKEVGANIENDIKQTYHNAQQDSQMKEMQKAFSAFKAAVNNFVKAGGKLNPQLKSRIAGIDNTINSYQKHY